MSRLLCFTAQHATIAALVEPFVKAPSELVEVKPESDIAWGDGLRKEAQPGDVLLIASDHDRRITGDVFEVARQIGLGTWHLSDHWVKAAEAPIGEAAELAGDETSAGIRPAEPAPAADSAEKPTA